MCLQGTSDSAQDGQQCAHVKPPVHLVAIRLPSPAHVAHAAMSPCGHFLAVATSDETLLLGLRVPPNLVGDSADPTITRLSGSPAPQKLRVARIALPDVVGPASALCFGCIASKSSGQKKRASSSQPAFRLFVADRDGLILQIQAGPADGEAMDVRTVHHFSCSRPAAPAATAQSSAGEHFHPLPGCCGHKTYACCCL
jgi:hypothetical protein